MATSSVAATPETEQVGYDPSLWGDFFIAYEPPPQQWSEQWMVTRAEKLKGDVLLLFKTCNCTATKTFLVDTIQHLGIHHHFEEEIDAALSDIFENEHNNSSSLHEVALRFRFLREHGYWDVFDKYKGEDRSFRIDVTNEPRRLLSLYKRSSSSDSWWWKHFLGYTEISFTLDRLVESYTWAYVLYYEKGSELPRSIITKMIVLITTLDDIYDVRATIEECRKLHEAIQCWDESAISLLPEYLKKLFMEFLRTFKDIEDEIPINMNYDISHLKKSIQNLVSGYMQEAEWSHKNYKPSFKDQVNLSCLTIGAPTVCTSMMVGMDYPIIKQALEWTAGVPDVVIAAGKRQKCKGDAASSVECYINEHNVSGEVAIGRIETLLEHQWRILNQARFENHELLPALQRIIGLALSATFFYDNKKDVFTVSKHLQKTVESIFVKKI